MSVPPTFSDPVTQALHEQNLEWLRLMREEPGWVLSRLDSLAELEEANTRLREAAKTLLGYWEPPERGTKAYDYWEPPDGKTTRRILDDFRAALALDEEQENA